MSAPATRSSRPPTKVIAASTAGTIVEWYDFFVYGTAAALVFGKLFFPAAGSELAGVLAALGTYAVGFVARPIGGVVFGHYGDKVGRKKLLQLSLLIIGISTFCIGLLPTYDSIGVWAPALLVTLRFLQGFALGGEWGGAVLLISEHGDKERRGLWSSFPQAAVPAGNILGDSGACHLVHYFDVGAVPGIRLADRLLGVGDPGDHRLLHPHQDRGRTHLQGGIGGGRA